MIGPMMDLNKKTWDGTDQQSGRDLSEGVYFYTLEALGADGKAHKLSGTIHLYR